MGFSLLSVGSPSAEKDGFSLSTNTCEWQLGRQTNIKIKREKAGAIDRQMPTTHTEKCWMLSTHAVIGSLAGKMENEGRQKDDICI